MHRTCQQPDRDVSHIKCGYPLPCPYHDRYGPDGEMLRQADRDHVRKDFKRRSKEGRIGLVEAAAVSAWFGAEIDLARIRKASEELLRAQIDLLRSVGYHLDAKALERKVNELFK